MCIVFWSACHIGRRWTYDYYFASPDLRAGARLRVFASDEWWGRSDQCPIKVGV
jgi:hypothetical protein